MSNLPQKDIFHISFPKTLSRGIDSVFYFTGGHTMANIENKTKALIIAIEKIFQRMSEDIFYFIEGYAYVEAPDELDGKTKFSLWEEQKRALRDMMENRLTIVLKARQLGLSWLALWHSLWNMLFKTGYQVVTLSKRDEDAKELILRMKFMLNELPNWLILEDIKVNRGKFAKLRFRATEHRITIIRENGLPSRMVAMPAAPDSGRSFTANLVILDEWAFQEFAYKIWNAAFPTIHRPTGGKVIGISTAKRATLFHEIWQNADDFGFKKIFLNWRADPRRDDAWYEQAKKALSAGRQYMAEFPNTPEEAFAAGTGIAFPEFTKDVHVCEPFTIPDHWRKWMSLDNGYTDPFAWYWYAIDEDGHIYVYREFSRDRDKDEKLLYSEQAEKVVELMTCSKVNEWGHEEIGLEKVDFIVAGADAWATHHKDSSGKNLIDYYMEGGLKSFGFRKAITDRKLRKATVHEYLKPIYDEKTQEWSSKVTIFNTCKHLIKTLPELLEDENDPEKVEDSDYDNCLTGDTIINTIDGDIPIKDLVGKTGKVYCYDEKLEQSTVSNFYDVRCTKKNADVYEIETEDGRVIKATDYHPILTKNGWKTISQLTENDYIIDIWG